jgi:hypothetical protein
MQVTREEAKEPTEGRGGKGTTGLDLGQRAALDFGPG